MNTKLTVSMLSAAALATAVFAEPPLALDLGKGVKLDMVWVPPGEFNMGSTLDGSQELPVHQVKIGKGFWMGKYEVTQEQYEAVIGRNPAGYKGARCPVENVSWMDAVAFAVRLNGLNILPAGAACRLPTEAEWEYACRAGSATAYHFGEESAELDDYAWFRENSSRRPHSVGLKQPNAWGLHDMHGNVAEWVLDRYDGEAYKQFTSRERALSPVLVPGREKFPHVVRGGSWREDATRLRCAARRASTEDWLMQDPQRPSSIWWLTEALHVGFRIVRPVEEQEELKGLRSLRKKYDY